MFSQHNLHYHPIRFADSCTYCTAPQPPTTGKPAAQIHRILRQRMNRFLKGIGITFRRDEETKRPRVNKLGSQLDRTQKAEGEYYYCVEGS